MSNVTASPEVMASVSHGQHSRGLDEELQKGVEALLNDAVGTEIKTTSTIPPTEQYLNIKGGEVPGHQQEPFDIGGITLGDVGHEFQTRVGGQTNVRIISSEAGMEEGIERAAKIAALQEEKK